MKLLILSIAINLILLIELVLTKRRILKNQHEMRSLKNKGNIIAIGYQSKEPYGL